MISKRVTICLFVLFIFGVVFVPTTLAHTTTNANPINQDPTPCNTELDILGVCDDTDQRQPSASDRDGDGVPDDVDLCPDFGLDVGENGCPNLSTDNAIAIPTLPEAQLELQITPDAPQVGTDQLDQTTVCNTLDGLDTDCDDTPDRIDLCPNTSSDQPHGCPDTDGDGWHDGVDVCPDSAGVAGPGIGDDGCPDADGDGFTDEEDVCPTVAAGPFSINGCPDSFASTDVECYFDYEAGQSEASQSDCDQDGVPDGPDQCPRQEGPAEFSGCPDTDSDSVHDNTDLCQDIPGTSPHGCPDSDGDGFFDHEDACIAEPGIDHEGSFFSQWDGCPDSDGDRFPDPYDLCPQVGGGGAENSWNGCPMGIDSDGDGREDGVDMCPFEFGETATEYFSAFGCPDADSDGIADHEDVCPTLPASLPPALTDGCPADYDYDNDGFVSEGDRCPNTAGPVEGCPDTDGDGFRDDRDRCPLQFGIEYPPSLISWYGCPDTDADGWPNGYDQCPNEVAAYEPPLGAGCPDSDGDGTPDIWDECEGFGTVNGCPDSDDDGVHDFEDLCPSVVGEVHLEGCLDIDGDGWHDGVDECINLPGVDALNGCPDPNAIDPDEAPPIATIQSELPGSPFVTPTPTLVFTQPDEITLSTPGIITTPGEFELVTSIPLPTATIDEAGGTEPTQAPTEPPPDSDGDGVYDDLDACPNEFGVATNDRATNGCPTDPDSDGDGVRNSVDDCPTIAGKIDGCPDSDGDGWHDLEDACPQDPGDELNSCPVPTQPASLTDSDGDGITNDVDACPDQAGIATNIRGTHGCPQNDDSDGDGFADKDDACPEVAGTDNGCPLDSDSDGVPDSSDACPKEVGVFNTSPGLNGCPTDTDTDRDGIFDSADACPREPGVLHRDPNQNGCPS